MTTLPSPAGRPGASLHYVSHPNVRVDPGVAVPHWSLSEVGRERTLRMLGQPWVASIERVISSPETKAVETATILADHLDLAVEVRSGTGEIDRSSTGFVPPERHDELADRCFASPGLSAAGWERAVDAQARIAEHLADLLDPAGPCTAVVGHGGVGTLWYCWLTEQAIDRRHDQPGQGHYFTVDLTSRAVLHPWRAIDDLAE